MSLKQRISLSNLASEEESKIKDLCHKELSKVRGGGCKCGGTACGYYGARDDYEEKDGDPEI